MSANEYAGTDERGEGFVTVYLGIDDTDTQESRGTGRLARSIADELSSEYTILGVTRHQLFVHDEIPYTSHNSAAVIHIDCNGDGSLQKIYLGAREMMLSDFIVGSDPGICIATSDTITPPVIAFGWSAKNTVLTQEDARHHAKNCGITLEGLGGTNGGIIGALAGVGLAASGEDGRFVMRGRSRMMTGTRSVDELLASGIDQIMTRDRKPVPDGLVEIRKFPKPALVNGQAVLYVTGTDGHYQDLVVG